MLTNSQKDGFDRSLRFETRKMGSDMFQTTTNGINILKTWAKGTFNPIIWDVISSVAVEETESWKKWKICNGKKK